MGAIERAFTDKDAEKEIRDLEGLLHELEDEPLTSWETDFVSDLLDRIDQYGGKTFVSDAQRGVIDRMEEKYFG